MTNYAIDDGDGNQLTAGLQDHNARKVAQRLADERGESVYLYEIPVRVDNDGDSLDESEEIAPTAKRDLIGWTTWGSVRGMGPVRETLEEAQTDLELDQQGCEEQRGYSDRDVYAIDHEGYVVHPETGDNVYPYGRTSAALKLGRGDARQAPEWMAVRS